jgi:hypothetical protein
MIIEVREPKEGELWWRGNSHQWIDGSARDGLYLYTRVGMGRPSMYRCYGAAKDLQDVILAAQFASVAYGTPVKVEPYQLIRGDWYLAAEQSNVGEFLKKQIEEYRQAMLRSLDEDVSQMLKVIEGGKNPNDVPPPWIR